ncbi:MAG: hypothetical protein AB1758_26650, partial [Candidatus Eremiobacterota bacterium]
RAAKDRVREDLILHLENARSGYPFVREDEAYPGRSREVKELLASPDFERFYPVFPMKDHARQLPERQNLRPAELSRTRWFRDQVAGLLQIRP